jgi:ubiquinone/menaquinone biosynthesis C-methylase UbiE
MSDSSMAQRVGYRRTHNLVTAELRKVKARRIADVGCGTGVLTAHLAKELRPDFIVGTELSPSLLSKARLRSHRVDWRNETPEKLTLDDDSVDALVTTEAFHFCSQDEALKEFARVVRPGGVVVIVTIATRRGAVSRTLTNGGIVFPTRRRMAQMVREAGFEVIEQRSIRRHAVGLPTSLATIGRRPEPAKEKR